ncbi:MAG: hypothetical protein HRT72_04290 [Flavobacteriales bacterium]|nr:hypothetical protein [Flavobacteriales bacterium]
MKHLILIFLLIPLFSFSQWNATDDKKEPLSNYAMVGRTEFIGMYTQKGKKNKLIIKANGKTRRKFKLPEDTLLNRLKGRWTEVNNTITFTYVKKKIETIAHYNIEENCLTYTDKTDCLFIKKEKPFQLNTSLQFQPSILWKPGYVSINPAFSILYKERFAASLGPTVSRFFIKGIGFTTGINYKIISKKKYSIGIDAIYLCNLKSESSAGRGETVLTTYSIPLSQFTATGISFDYKFENQNRIRITPTYYAPIKTYSSVLTFGIRDENLEKKINTRFKASFGLHFTILVTHL